MTITREGAIAEELAIGTRSAPGTLGPLELLDLLQDYTAEMAGLLPVAEPGLTERRYELLELTDELEIWAIHWPQGRGSRASRPRWLGRRTLGRRREPRGALPPGSAHGGPPHARRRRRRGIRTGVHPRRGERATRPGHQRARLLSPYAVHDLLPAGGAGPRGRSGRVPRRSLVGPLSAVDRLLAQARLGLHRVDAGAGQADSRRGRPADRHPAGRAAGRVR